MISSLHKVSSSSPLISLDIVFYAGLGVTVIYLLSYEPLINEQYKIFNSFVSSELIFSIIIIMLSTYFLYKMKFFDVTFNGIHIFGSLFIGAGLWDYFIRLDNLTKLKLRFENSYPLVQPYLNMNSIWFISFISMILFMNYYYQQLDEWINKIIKVVNELEQKQFTADQKIQRLESSPAFLESEESKSTPSPRT